MRIGHATITDLAIMPDFVVDYNNAPIRVQNKVDRIIDAIEQSGRLPNSLNARQAAHETLYIGYVNRKRQHWRILFEYDNGMILLLRLLTYNEMVDYFD